MYLDIKERLKNKLFEIDKESLLSHVNPKNILTLLTYTMETVEVFAKNSTGEHKKQMCLNIIYDLIDESDIPSRQKEYLIDMLSNIFDPFVENVIAISKGKFNINNAVSLVKRLFKCINLKKQ